MTEHDNLIVLWCHHCEVTSKSHFITVLLNITLHHRVNLHLKWNVCCRKTISHAPNSWCEQRTIYILVQGGATIVGWTGFFLLCIDPHFVLKLLVALESTGWCVLGCWLTFYSTKAPLFAMTASRQRRNEQQESRMYSDASQSHSAGVDGHSMARLEIRSHLDFLLQNI